VRTLRNKLEEADDALDETSIRPEDIDVLQAAGESRKVLNRLERAIQNQQDLPLRTVHSGDDTAANFLNDIDEVTRKLCTALEALERSNGTIGLLLNDASLGDRSSTQTPKSPSSMTTISEDSKAMSTASSSWSFSSKRTSLSHRLSVNSETPSSHDRNPPEEKQVSPPRTMAGTYTPLADRRRTAPALGSDRWSTQFAYFDPMSVDIDSASSMILGGGLSPRPPPHSPARIGTPVSNTTEPPSAATRLSLDNPMSDSDSYVARSASLRGTPMYFGTERTNRLTSSASLRYSQKSPRLPQTSRQTSDEATPRILVTPMNAIPVLEAPTYQQVRASIDIASTLAPEEPAPAEHSSNSLSRRTSRIRDRILARSAQAARSRYRIVNPEKDDLNRTDSAREADSPASSSSLSSTYSPAEMRERTFGGFTPSLYKIQSLPTTRVADEEQDGDAVADSELDQEIMSAIISSWNSSQWDQAKHNIEILASRHSDRSDTRLVRRLQHLLGVIDSVNGQLDQALGHFLAVFSVPIGDAAQLDVGHCTATYWMGDVYALLNRKTEALLAYAVAARNPLFENLEWLPLQQQVLAEKEACRSGGVKTGVNISLDHESHDEDTGAADSILDSRIVGRDVARAIMQADIQPSSRECPKLDARQSRAMALHDFGKQSGPWQDLHKLELDASAFDPSSAWPLPFDPFFVLETVRQHRLSTPESDLLRCGLSAAKIPKKSRLTFSCQDLRWLIVTLRACLTRLEIEWSEAVIEHGPRFLARYKVAGTGIATSHFFSIPIYRLSFRPGYGVDICPDGIFSSRIQDVDAKSEKGEQLEEVKRVRKMIKEGLETAAKRQEATESKSMAFPVMSINGVTSLHRR
jgi:hypothetical protein